ncbi:hypothetical protein FSB78_07205 [Sphingomonas ginsenosidivorax]|uniref:Uncharacterized protein n=1 Tax=Sphingomonas ginsenosidivorax TaxID=862135 RepID=A0A5C6UFM8_9SPHN|nr:hypothetical protein [Sphingomonas ginsenosidivorax]TXC70748.1 hypothetical protein FSB78_07205 [Sphingomonas ginsenosidivorax]
MSRAIAPRLFGVALLLASGGTTLLHRAIYAAARPAQALELAIGLTTFLLASVGILLLIHGPALLVRTTPGLTPDTGSRKREPET